MLLEGRAQASGVREHASDASLLLVVNAYHEGVDFALPDDEGASLSWSMLLSTDAGLASAQDVLGAGHFLAPPRSLTVFRCGAAAAG